MVFVTKDIVELLNGSNDEWLYQAADKAKRQTYGNKVFVRGIIENSNICDRNCLYCGVRKENKELKRYSLSEAEILECARGIRNQGIKSIVMQSGESQSHNDKKIAQTIAKIKTEIPDCDVTISFGEKSRDVFKMYKDNGADRCLLKVETLQDDVYEYAHSGYKLKDRIKSIEDLLDLGYQVGSGFIYGLPLYTQEKFAQDLLSLQKLGVHMYSTTPFIASKNTPFADLDCGEVNAVYRSNAIYRIMEPTVNIPVTSALASLDENSKAKGLRRGANVLMLSFTPESVRKDYSIYRGKNTVKTEELNALEALEEEVKKADMVPAYERGRSLYQYKGR